MAGTRRRRRRTNRRRNRRVGLRRRATTAPPRLSITANTRNLQISYAYDVTTNYLRKDIRYSDVFTYPPNIGLGFQFTEGRILSANIYWQSDNSTADAGSVCLNIESYGENYGTETCDFPELIAYPGSMIRKVWQNVSNRWFPTEPTDRDFRALTSDSGIMTVTVRHSVPSANLKGRVLILLAVRLRGKTTARCPKKLLEAVNRIHGDEPLDVDLAAATLEKIRVQTSAADDP